MFLDYRDPNFWKKFHADHWQPRVPTVIRQPFKTPLFSNESLHRALVAFEHGLTNGNERSPCLVSIGDKERPPHAPLRKLFSKASDSMDGLEQNIAKVFPQKRFGLMVTHFQNVHPEIWDGITAFIQDARKTIDFPVPRAFLDLFYGNYLDTFTGLHKDTQEIFAFVVRGKKRMLAWPFDYFLSRVDDLSPGAKYFHMRLDIDPRKYRKDAIVLDAEPGDVFYWPSDHWHVTEAQPGRAYSGMISLGLFRPEFTPPKPAHDQARFLDRLLAGDSSAVPSQDMTSALTATDSSRQLRWVTGFGFELGGPISDRRAGKRAPATKKRPVAKKENCLILWKVTPSPKRLLVSANGHSITLPYSAKTAALLEKLAAGETVSLPPPSAKRTDAKILETNWSKRNQLVTRKVAGRDSNVALADWLLRVSALTEFGDDL